MKLILSSRDFSEPDSNACIRQNLGMPLEDCKVLYFPNDKADERSILGNKYYNRLARFGFQKENITVFNYYNPAPFFSLSPNAIYISGGNTFGTLARIRKAGFTEAIVHMVKRGSVYIGGSAGAHIASANIEHVARYDENTVGMTDFSGLQLYDGIFICHYSDEREEHFKALQNEGRFPVTPLKNQDSLVIEKEFE